MWAILIRRKAYELKETLSDSSWENLEQRRMYLRMAYHREGARKELRGLREKVHITQIQHDEIKDIRDVSYAINAHSFNLRPDKAIATLTTADLARILLLGEYEIIEGGTLNE